MHDDETLREQSKKRRMEQEYYDKLRELGWRRYSTLRHVPLPPFPSPLYNTSHAHASRRADGSLERDPDVEWDSDADESPPPPPPGVAVPPTSQWPTVTAHSPVPY